MGFHKRVGYGSFREIEERDY